MIRKIWNGFLDLLFPPKCPFCEKLLEKSSDGMCPRCQRTLPWLTEESAEQKLKDVSLCVSPLRYQNEVRESIRRYKFHGRTGYGGIYGALVAQCINDHLKGRFDMISWTPLSKKRERSRGYNQAFLVAQVVAKELEIPLVGTLHKVRDTPAQSGLTNERERHSNVLGVYALADKGLVEGKRILLIDDVVTTGSTLSECAGVLRMGGAKDVVCATVARAH